MPIYLISKPEQEYVVFRDRHRFNPDKNYAGIVQVIFDILTGEDAPGDISIVLGQEVKTEKDALRMIYIFNAFKEQDKRSESAEGRLAELAKALKDFNPEMSVGAFLDTARLEGFLD